MDFDFQWLLLGLPLAFALGWLASRLDLRQWRREQQRVAQGLFQGPEPAAQRAAGQGDRRLHRGGAAATPTRPTCTSRSATCSAAAASTSARCACTSTCCSRADLPAAERERAQHALAQDFMKAGLFDRAEDAFGALRRHAVRHRGAARAAEPARALARLARRGRRSRTQLERSGTGSFASRIAHYWCELALEAERAADAADGARQRCSARASRAGGRRGRCCMAGQRRARRADHASALEAWGELMATPPGRLRLVAAEYAASAGAAASAAQALGRARDAARRAPVARRAAGDRRLDPDPARARARLLAHLRRAADACRRRSRCCCASACSAGRRRADGARSTPVRARARAPLRRYRCAACGFEAQHYFWQCPGCLGWDTLSAAAAGSGLTGRNALPKKKPGVPARSWSRRRIDAGRDGRYPGSPMRVPPAISCRGSSPARPNISLAAASPASLLNLSTTGCSFFAHLGLFGRRQLGDLHAVLLQLAERRLAEVADRLALEQRRLARRLLTAFFSSAERPSQAFFDISSTQHAVDVADSTRCFCTS